MKTKKNSQILNRFFIIFLSMFMFMGASVLSIIKIQFKERDNWLELTKKYNKKEITVRPNRGNIYSANGELMSSSIPMYYVNIDMRVPALHLGNDSAFYNNIDSLSYYLAKYFGNKTQNTYKKDLTKAFKRKTAEYKLLDRRISYSELKDIKKFPLLKRGRYKSGLFTKEMFVRVKPYGTLASRTIGDIYADETKGGKNGLELGFDSILTGKSGVSTKMKVANKWQEIIEVEPKDGMDIKTTIDVDMQDIAEKELLKKLKDIDAQTGYAILMEVKTGEIKAIVNMYKNSDGTYSENKNGAVGDQVEPGSTFKIASLTALLDDGKAKLTDVIETGNGLYRFEGATMVDHNYNKGGYGTIDLEKAINASSNVGVSKAVVKAYGNHPEEFINKLYNMGLNEKFNLHIPGIAAPKIKHPKDKTTYWSAISLPWISIGYEVEVAPIYTLAFFNAIANNGKFIEPILVKSISQNGQILKQFETRVIREQMCKPTTIRDVKRAMLGVVESPKYGTGKPAHSKYVRIAGKTGTAQISKGEKGYKDGGKKYQVSFCGFFPYETPQYSCIVVIREPRIGYPSGGKMAGEVVKNIAEKVEAICSLGNIYDLEKDTTNIKAKEPIIKAGNREQATLIMEKLGLPFEQNMDKTWENITKKSNENQRVTNSVKMPKLIGMGAKDALFICEKMEMKASLQGVGKVIKQSIPHGTIIRKGTTINILLSNK